MYQPLKNYLENNKTNCDEIYINNKILNDLDFSKRSFRSTII